MAGSAFGIKDACNVTFKNLSTGSIIYVPYFNKFGIDLTGDSVYALKKGQKSIKWNKAMEGSFSADLEVINSQIMALLLGTELLTATTTNVFRKETPVVTNADTFTLAEVPMAGSITVMIPDDDNAMAFKNFTCGTTTPVAGTCKIAGSILTFYAGEVPAGTKLFITYLTVKNGSKKFSVTGNASSSNYAIYADVECKMEGDGSSAFRQLCLPKTSIKRQMKLDFDSEKASSFTMSGDLLCDQNDTMLTWTEI